MSRRLDIGVASYRNPERLTATLRDIEQRSATDWRCLIVHNPCAEKDTERACWRVFDEVRSRNSRFQLLALDENVGYAGAVNRILSWATTEYVAYCDNDIEIATDGWDERFASVLDANAECGQVFPGRGHYGFHNGRYHECLWNAGYCWMLRRAVLGPLAGLDRKRGLTSGTLMDEALGHHEEVDLMIRLRLLGKRIGCCPEVEIIHHESATRANGADHQPGGRIHDGVVRWMNKWNHYFCGDQLRFSMTAYDERALRYTDWNADALYLERMTLHHFPDWNRTPRSVMVPGVGEMDVIEVLKPKGPYAGRAI